MKVESIRDVKARLNRIVAELPQDGSVVITRNGKPCAVLMPVTSDTDLEIVALSQNKRFWTMYDQAQQRGDHEGWVELASVADEKSDQKRRIPSRAAGARRGRR
jgi:prevent-host-death family protein